MLSLAHVVFVFLNSVAVVNFEPKTNVKTQVFYMYMYVCLSQCMGHKYTG